jgi:hypothetical protein
LWRYYARDEAKLKKASDEGTLLAVNASTGAGVNVAAICGCVDEFFGVRPIGNFAQLVAIPPADVNQIILRKIG